MFFFLQLYRLHMHPLTHRDAHIKTEQRNMHVHERKLTNVPSHTYELLCDGSLGDLNGVAQLKVSVWSGDMAETAGDWH